MIRFKLCKAYNTVEIEFADFASIDSEVVSAVYDLLPEYTGVVPGANKFISKKDEQPSEAQIKFAESLGIKTKGKTKSQLWMAIKKAQADDED